MNESQQIRIWTLEVSYEFDIVRCVSIDGANPYSIAGRRHIETKQLVKKRQFCREVTGEDIVDFICNEIGTDNPITAISIQSQMANFE